MYGLLTPARAVLLSAIMVVSVVTISTKVASDVAGKVTNPFSGPNSNGPGSDDDLDPDYDRNPSVDSDDIEIYDDTDIDDVTDGNTTADGGEDRDEYHDVGVYDNDEVGNKLHVAAQPTRRKLLLDIVAHPSQAPSAAEFEFQNPNLSRTGILNHLEELQEVDLVKKIELPKGKRERDRPHSFWTFTDEGKRFLERHDLIPVDPRPLQETYKRTEKSEKIQRYENTERPDGIPRQDQPDHGTVEGVEEIFRQYQETGDAKRAGKELAELEEGNEEDPEENPTPDIEQKLLMEIVASIRNFEGRIARLERQLG